jgi:hypothetical protein
MTLLGRILVIVNLVFSVVTGVLVVTVFVTRTNWKIAYDGLRKRYEVAEANARIYADEAKEIKNAAESELKKAKAEQTPVERDRDSARKELEDRVAELRAAEQRLSQANANIKAATEEINRRKQEIDNLKTVMAEKDDRIVQLESQSKQYRDQAITAEIAAKTEHERNLNLLQQNVELSQQGDRRNASGLAGGTGTASAKRPPQEDVQGVVLETDPHAGLVTISIGSDAGIAKGNTLEVYRYKPRPEYVGTVTVIDASFHEAVARPIMPLRAGPIQKGDTVASRIMMTSRR